MTDGAVTWLIAGQGHWPCHINSRVVRKFAVRSQVREQSAASLWQKLTIRDVNTDKYKQRLGFIVFAFFRYPRVLW